VTCIAAIASNGKVTMGADSAGVNSDGHLQLRKDSKVFKNGEYLIGCAGSWRAMQAIRFADLPEKGAMPEPALYHMVKDFLPALRKINLPEDKDFELLVGFRGRLFHVYNTSQVSEEIADYEACGSGAQVARGSLYSTDREPHVSPEVRIKLALQAAERFCSGVRGPFNILEV